MATDVRGEVARLLESVAGRSVGALGDIDPHDLVAEPEVAYEHLTPAAAKRVAAALELARLLAAAEAPKRVEMRNSADVARYLFARHAIRGQEVFGAVFLDVGLRLIADEVLFVGSLTRCAVDARVLFRRALQLRAAKVVLFHTHPSGEATPSEEDCIVTRMLVLAGETLSIEVVDHLVVGAPGTYTSLRDRGKM